MAVEMQVVTSRHNKGIESIDVEALLRTNRLRWYGHIERNDGWINKCRSIKVNSLKGPGRPKKTWEETVKKDCEVAGMDGTDPRDRSAWRKKLYDAKTRPTPRMENETLNLDN